MNEKLNGIIRRALVSRGHQRIADLREALSLAVSSSGAETRDMPATNSIPSIPNPWGMLVTGKATDKATTIASLRDMLNDDGIKGNAKALASIVHSIRQLSS